MNQSIVITQHVINTIKSLPMEERLAIASALAGEMILGATIDENAENGLTPMQTVLYSMIRDYIRRDSHKLAKAI